MSYRRTNYRRTYTPRVSGWRGPAPLEVLNESLTMSAAGTFTEIEVSLLEEVGKLNRGRIKAMMIHRIELQHTGVAAGTGMDTDNATGDSLMFQVCSSEQGAEVNFSDRDCVTKIFIEKDNLGTQGNLALFDNMLVKEFPGAGIPYIKKRIWFGAVDVGQGQANTYHFKIYYTFKYLNKKTQTRIISQLQ